MVSPVSTVFCSDTWAQQTERYYAVRGVNVTDVILLVNRRRDRSSFGTGGMGRGADYWSQARLCRNPLFSFPNPKAQLWWHLSHPHSNLSLVPRETPFIMDSSAIFPFPNTMWQVKAASGTRILGCYSCTLVIITSNLREGV